jgi:hypothetical protein
MANLIPGIGGSSSSQQVDLVETSRAAKQGVQGAAQSVEDPASPASVGDATSLSNLGSFIATAAKRAGGHTSIRPEIVASLKAQIAAGIYHPDPDEVAARVAAALKL